MSIIRVVEIVQISMSDNILTLLRYFQYIANVLHISHKTKRFADNLFTASFRILRGEKANWSGTRGKRLKRA